MLPATRLGLMKATRHSPSNNRQTPGGSIRMNCPIGISGRARGRPLRHDARVMLLVPADPLRPRRPDDHFAPEADAARAAGTNVAVVYHEALIRDDPHRAMLRWRR